MQCCLCITARHRGILLAEQFYTSAKQTKGGIPMLVKRGEIYYADLSPVVGSEQGGIRPVLIVQNDIGNRHSPTVIAAAITSRRDKAKLPTHIDVQAATCGLTKDSVVLLEQTPPERPDGRTGYALHDQGRPRIAGQLRAFSLINKTDDPNRACQIPQRIRQALLLFLSNPCVMRRTAHEKRWQVPRSSGADLPRRHTLSA